MGTKLIKDAGDSLSFKIERGDHIVPNMDEAFPKKKSDEADGNGNKSSGKRPYWIQSLEKGQGVKGQNAFTTVGKPKMAQKQFNSPMQMYSDEALEEIMRDGTLGGKPFNAANAMNPTGQEFDKAQSGVLQFILGNEPMSLETNE